jgi:hypothetical protein
LRIDIGEEEFARRLGELCTSGVGPGFPRRRRDAQILLHSMAMCFTPGMQYTERAAGDLLRAWLEAAGPRVEMDHVSMRRALVDHGHLTRDAAGRSYAVNPGSHLFRMDPLQAMRAAHERVLQRKQKVREGGMPA